MTDLFPAIITGDALDEKQATIVPFVCNGAVTKGNAVKVSTHIAGAIAKCAVAGAGDHMRGVALKSGADGEVVPVLILGGVKVVASGAITAGQGVKSDVAGAVAYDSSNVYDSYALQTFADGDVGLIFVK